MALNIHHKDYEENYATIVEKFPKDVYPKWQEFTLIEKDKLIRKFKTLRKNANECQCALRNMTYLPKALEKLGLEPDQAIELKIETIERTKELAEAPVVEVNGDDLLDKVDLESPRMDVLIPSLLLVSGRRTIEIMKTGSLECFESEDEKEDVEYKAIFSGQAKSSNTKPYQIPLLAPVEKVKLALAAVRQAYPLQNKDNNDINAVYSKTINKMCKAMFGLGAHELRAVYAHMCQLSFNKGPRKMSVSGYISKTLGHEAPTTSLHYQRVCVNNYTGPLKEKPLTVEMLISRIPSYTKAEEKKKNIISDIMSQGKYFDHKTLSKEYGTTAQVWKKWIERNSKIFSSYFDIVKPEKPKVERKRRSKKNVEEDEQNKQD